VIYTCPGCGELQTDGAYCPRCARGVPWPSRPRLSAVALMVAPHAQREYVRRLLGRMDRTQLAEVVFDCFERARPLERSLLLGLLADTANAQPFEEATPCP
jgi:hypothetical protein